MNMDYSCGHLFQTYPGAAVPIECPKCREGRLLEPLPQQASDWPDGLPPVGHIVELSYTPEDDRWWPKGQVIAYHKEWVIFEREGKARPLIRTYDCVRFRPRRSRKERERDEAIQRGIELATKAAGHEAGLIPISNIVVALYDAGMLRKAGEL